MKLLVIEDEVKLAEYLRKGLTESGYVVDVAHDGIDGLHLAMEGGYDLLLLDSMLPGIDGLALLAAFRKSKQTPVLMLTARVHVDDRVRGLQGGADDYLTKPFAFSELTARIQVLLRRAAPSHATVLPTVIGVSDLEVDLLRRKATRAGQRLDLTAKEFNLLALLLRRQGEVLSRTELRRDFGSTSMPKSFSTERRSHPPASRLADSRCRCGLTDHSVSVLRCRMGNMNCP